MIQPSLSRREHRLLYLAAYLTLAAVAAAGLSTLTEGRDRWIAAGLLLAFGLLMTRVPSTGTAGKSVLLYLTAQTVLVAGLLAVQSDGMIFPILYFILSAQAMLLLPQRQAALWIVALTLVTGGAFVYAVGWHNGLLTLPIYAGGYFFFGVFAHALAQADLARSQSQTLLTELQEAHRQLQDYAARIETLAVAEERNRLAREMHDTLGHRLTVAAVQLEGAQRLIPSNPERAIQMVGTVREQVREALSELRCAVAALKAPLEADLSLPKALTRLATGFEEATGITVHCTLPGEMPPLPDSSRLALYRAAQEALTNIQRHANAGQVWLTLTVGNGTATLHIRDDGQGFPPGAEQAGFGLRGLRERATQLGGELHLESGLDGGAQVALQIPLPASGSLPTFHYAPPRMGGRGGHRRGETTPSHIVLPPGLGGRGALPAEESDD